MTKPALLLSRPAVIGALSLAIGILLGKSSDVEINRGVLLTTSAAFGLLTFVAARRRQRGRLLPHTVAPHTLGAAVLLITVGYLRIASLSDTQEQLVSKLAESPTTSGVIRGPITQTEWSTRFRLVVPDPRGAIQVSLAGGARERWAASLADGDTLVLRGPLDATVRKRNPTDFDYGAFLFWRSILGAVTVSDPDAVLAAGRDPQVVPSAPTGRSAGVSGMIIRLREKIVANITEVTDGRSAPVLRALILDDGSAIDEDVRDALSRAGLMHLLSVSGLHVMLVGFALYRTLFSVLVRLRIPWYTVEWIRSLSTVALLCLYAALTGNAPPVTRAVIMAALLMGQTLVRRQADTLNTLGAAAAVMLVYRPAQLFDVGFQLSFAAVAAIVVVGPPIRDRLAREGKKPGFLSQSIGVSAAATVGTAPIVVWTFGYVPLAGIVLNVAAVPLASAALAAGLLMVLVYPLSSAAASMFAGTAEVSTELILLIADFADQRMSAAVLQASTDPYRMITVLALTGAAVAHVARFRSRWRWTIALLAFVFMVSCAGTLRSISESRFLNVVFVDVGQGDAAIIRTPGGAFLVVDAGPPGRGLSPAERTIVPMLRSMGARQIDALVLSHPHADHDGGVEVLINQFEAPLVVNNGLESVPGQLASQHGLELKFSGGVSARVLSPPDDWPRDRLADELANNYSVVLRIDYGSVCFLFAGDIEAEAEAALVSRGEDMDCEVVKVPHHGSRSSSTWPFVKATGSDAGESPRQESYAVVSAGARNRFGHPAPEVVERWRGSGRTVLSTAGGARWFRSDGQSVWLHRWR